MTGPGPVRPGAAAGLVGTTGQIHQPVPALSSAAPG
jgi:hypothetical protein